MTLTAIAGPLPMTRQAVTKHVDALREAGLVKATRVGRERLNELDVEPLKKVEAWLEPYAAAWDRRLVALQQYLEEEDR